VTTLLPNCCPSDVQAQSRTRKTPTFLRLRPTMHRRNVREMVRRTSTQRSLSQRDSLLGSTFPLRRCSCPCLLPLVRMPRGRRAIRRQLQSNTSTSVSPTPNSLPGCRDTEREILPSVPPVVASRTIAVRIYRTFMRMPRSIYRHCKTCVCFAHASEQADLITNCGTASL
jgi:hypothetical protein